MMKMFPLAGLLTAMIVAGCSHPRYYHEAEEHLGVAGHFESKGHFAAYYPHDISLTFPGYVVGTELGDRRALLGNDRLAVNRFVDAEGRVIAGGTITRIVDGMIDGERLPFVSHVIRYAGQPLGARNCAMYSVYQTSTPELIDFCDDQRRPEITEWSTYRSAFADSWTAIDSLKGELEREADSGKYSHLVVAMMGWRTSQEEAIRNFNSIVRSIHMAAGDAFRPLFVGITWMGRWEGRWLDPLSEMVSYPVVADLADQLGLTWVGVLNREIVLPLSARLPTVYVTHSFGARTAATAVCIGPAIRRNTAVAKEPVSGTVDVLIAFQAAFSLQRFKDRRPIWFYEDVHFPNGCTGARSIVLTSSRHDMATRSVVWADFAGNHDYFISYCGATREPGVGCVSVDTKGDLENEYDHSSKLIFLDASKLIAFTAPGTEGAAHSDIFRQSVGRLIWNLVSKQAPGRGMQSATDRPH